MKLIYKLSLIALLLTSFSLFAQEASVATESTDPPTTEPEKEEVKEEEETSFSFSGYVDAYYQANLTTSEGADEAPLAFPTSFTDFTNTFGIGNVNLLAEKTMGKVSFVGQVGFGPRATQANGGNGANFASTVQQLYVAYSPSESVTFTLGNFGTFVGYEVIDANANVNYSTSYLFSNGPFFHTGAKVDFAIAEGFGAMVGVFNDTDAKIDAIEGKHLGAQLSAETGGLAAYLNVLAGKEDEGITDDSDDDLNEFQVDLTATYEVSESFMLGLNASSYSTSRDGNGEGGFFGTALYATIGASDNVDIGLRAEYFNLTAPEGVTIDEPNVLSITASGNITIDDDLRIIPEIRFDTGSNGVVFGDDPADESVAAFILAAVYTFN